MEWKSFFSVLAGVVFIAGFVPYIRAIVRKETKPSKASWIIWASLDIITLAGMYAAKTVNGQIVAAVVGALVVVALAFVYGTPGWTRLDKTCLVGAVGAILLWRIFDSPVLGIVTSSGVVFLGAIPTFISAWKKPENEDKLAWTIYWVSCVCALVAVPQWTFADAAQPVAFFTIESVMMYILHVRGRSLPSTQPA